MEGRPSDASVLDAIANLKARGLNVMLYPFVMMDVPAGNVLPNPWSSSGYQAAYPWRGRITCYPTRGVAGSVDGTTAAQTQVHAFFGTARATDFASATSALSLAIDYAGNTGDAAPITVSSSTDARLYRAG